MTVYVFLPISQRIFSQEKRLTGSVTRTMAAMSLGFIVMVTPWTIQEVVAACTGSKVIYLIFFFFFCIHRKYKYIFKCSMFGDRRSMSMRIINNKNDN